jgi:protein-tyrosine phosphatase
LIVVVAAAMGGYAYRQHHRYKHFAVHEPGQVYRCGWVDADVMEELVRKYHVKAVINLCRPGEMGPERAAEERQAVEAAGGKLLELPMPDTADPEDPRIAAHKAALTDPTNFPILVHCQHGVNRTARTIAMYEVLVHNLDGEAAVRRMPRFGRRQYEELEYEFARNFTRAYRTTQNAANASGDLR